MKRPTEYYKRTYESRDYWKFLDHPTGDIIILLDKGYVEGKSEFGECVVIYSYFTWIFATDLGFAEGDVFDHVLKRIENDDFMDRGFSDDRNDDAHLLAEYQVDLSKTEDR